MTTPDPTAVTITTLDEIALAISELGFRRETGELSWPELEPEHTALKAILRQHVALLHAGVDPCDLAALLILDGMVAQHLCDLRLASQSQTTVRQRASEIRQ
jgi:hypothetical protein